MKHPKIQQTLGTDIICEFTWSEGEDSSGKFEHYLCRISTPDSRFVFTTLGLEVGQTDLTIQQKNWLINHEAEIVSCLRRMEEHSGSNVIKYRLASRESSRLLHKFCNECKIVDT